MTRLWSRISERIDAATLRERVFIFAALVVLLVTLFESALIGAEFAAQKRIGRDIAQRQTESAALREKLTALVTARQGDPGRADRERAAQLGAQIAQAEARIAEQQRRFTTPAQVRALLEDMLGRSGKVTLVEMKTLPTSEVADTRTQAGATAPPAKAAAAAPKAQAGPSAGPAPTAQGSIYRHGIEITLAGDYLDLLAYVSGLESQPTQLYWGGAEMKAESHPLVTLKLRLYTLSLDKAWMNV